MNWIAQYWLEACFGLLVSAIIFGTKKIFTKFKAIKEEQAAQSRGIQALLRDSIVRAYYHYCDDEVITLHGLQNVNAMYEEYHNLGGNGTITKLVNDIRKFEVVDRRDKNEN